MRLLLDTHVALWSITDNPNLPAKARELIANPANLVAVSVASIWEISIKCALARDQPNDMPISGAEAAEYFRSAGYILLNISPEHAAAVEHLPPPARRPIRPHACRPSSDGTATPADPRSQGGGIQRCHHLLLTLASAAPPPVRFPYKNCVKPPRLHAIRNSLNPALPRLHI
jgi:PIN domain nuclease of toxin-antitoxin system